MKNPGLTAIRVKGDRFVDDQGRQVLLHGLCVISKSKDENYLSWHRAEDFAKMASWGMNCMRLGIIWDGVEPELGNYDDKYLDGVAQRAEPAKQTRNGWIECGWFLVEACPEVACAILDLVDHKQTRVVWHCVSPGGSPALAA